jgi:hypothetical protein
MTVTCDDQRRVVLPGARPGDRFEVQDSGAQKVLTLLEPAQPKVVYGKLIQTDVGLMVEFPGVTIEPESFGKAISQAIREDRAER